MSLKDRFSVKPIKKFEVAPWLLKKHYAKRMPNILYAFGVYDKNILCGCVTYGMTANNNLNELAGVKTLELNRLCIDSEQKNIASFLVGNSLKMIPKPVVIVSYADTGQGHIGYIYQATNWIYTGMGKGDFEFIKNGRQYHRKNIYDKLGTGSIKNAERNGYRCVIVKPKHRYLYVVANKKDRKRILDNLPWKQKEYPKGETKRYDASAQVQTQICLF